MQAEFSRKFDVIKSSEKPPTWVNVGEPSVTGLVEVGNLERKETCEDVKLHDPEKGLFLVADGVSTTFGHEAAYEVARLTDEKLGQQLDEQIERIVNNRHLDLQRQSVLIAVLVRSELQNTLIEANVSLQQRSSVHRWSGTAATTASVLKLVEMPGGVQRAFFANVGDSRIYLQRGKTLIRLTQDDSLLAEAINNGTITTEQATSIDQVSSIDDLPDSLRPFFRYRHQLTRSIGGMKALEIDIQSRDVELGDRLLLVSDGVSDQLKEGKLAYTLASQNNDQAAERSIQTAAEQMSLRGTDARAKADDISAIVHTIGKQGVDRSYLYKNVVDVSLTEITPKRIERWKQQIPLLEQRIQQLRRAGESTKELEQELARHEFWVARMGLKEIEEQIPPQFSSGDHVKVWRQDLEPPSFDRVAWIVKHYDLENQRYVVSDESNHQHKLIDRFTLELWQLSGVTIPGHRVQLQQGKALKQQLISARERLT